MYQISERHGHLFVFNNRCGILQFAVCILRVVISSVVLRHPSCHIILSGGATFPHYRCGGVLYAPLLLGLSAYVLACDGQSQRKRGVAIPIYIYNVQLMLTEERRKIPVPSRDSSALDIVFFANRERGLEFFALSMLSP